MNCPVENVSRVCKKIVGFFLPRRGRMSITPGFNRGYHHLTPLFLALTGRYKVA